MKFCEFLLIDRENQFQYLKDLKPDWLQIESSTQTRSIVSNVKENCDIYAPEINWYLKNSTATAEEKLENLKRMYFSRMARYEYGTDRDFSIEVGKKLLVIGDTQEAKEFLEYIQNDTSLAYEVGLLKPQDILSVSGRMGAFEAKIQIDESVAKVVFHQAVIFYEDDALSRFMGIEKASDFSDAHSLIEKLNSRLGSYEYQTTITYQSQNCQYYHRRPDKNLEGYCHKCANVCPTFGVTKDDSLMELSFSALDCIGCGGCVAVCPSGSIDYAPFSMQAFIEALKHYHHTHILLIAQPFLEDLKDFPLPAHLSPLIINREKFLSETHILALLQESGSSCVYYSPILSKPSIESIELINGIYQNIYQKDGFYVAKNIEELKTNLNHFEKIQSYHYTPRNDEYKRKHFSERLRFAIKDNDYGKVPSGKSNELIRYGNIYIQEENCTLCLSCVGACNVGSLVANTSNLSLEFNPSVCTTCGYCVDSCPENVISLKLDGIALNPSWFENKVLAQDEMFECIECKKPFATTRSIQKVKSMMLPLFGDDKAKIKTLECCPDCKIKIMFSQSELA